MKPVGCPVAKGKDRTLFGSPPPRMLQVKAALTIRCLRRNYRVRRPRRQSANHLTQCCANTDTSRSITLSITD